MTKRSNKVERPTNRGLTLLVTLQRAQKQACKRMVGRIDRDGGGEAVYLYIICNNTHAATKTNATRGVDGS